MVELPSFSSFDADYKSIVLIHQPTTYPSILYHYTDDAGLKGIVESKTLWASHYRYTNDSEEVTYGIKLATELLEKEMPKSTASNETYTIEEGLSGSVKGLKPSDVLIEVALATLRTPNIEEKSRYEFFFVCFSEEGDQLSQWRAYARNATGYAVGFSGSTLMNKCVGEQLREDELGDTIDLLKVIYDPEKQRALCQQIIQFARDFVDHRIPGLPHTEYSKFLGVVNLWLMASLVRTALFFKHSGFSEEKEWRLIVCRSRSEVAERPTAYPTKTRTTSFGITPYVVVPLCEEDQPLHLEHVVVGPRCEAASNTNRSTFGLSVLFEQLADGKPKKGIQRSDIPFR